MKSGDFLHRKQGSGLYWLLFTVFVEFKVFTIKKKVIFIHKFSFKGETVFKQLPHVGR